MAERSLFILGRQASIGIAELESVYGSDAIKVVSPQCATCDIQASEIDFGRLGSSIKLGSYLGSLPTARWQEVKERLVGFALRCAKDIPDGKVQFGFSVYDFPVSSQQLMATGLSIKKQLRNHGYSARLVPNKEEALSSAQVLHNNLVGQRGIELLVVRNGSRTIIGRTEVIQDIAAYSARDHARPKRDAFVGMLPPKLAQTIVNLATAQAPTREEHIILDPFCGTGVILQEALLMGYGAYGSDLEARMIEYSKKNLEWLANRESVAEPMLETGDATTYRWRHAFSTVASETYLGRPLSSWPAP